MKKCWAEAHAMPFCVQKALAWLFVFLRDICSMMFSAANEEISFAVWIAESTNVVVSFIYMDCLCMKCEWRSAQAASQCQCVCIHLCFSTCPLCWSCSLPLIMNDGVAGPLWTEQMPTEQISRESPPDVIAAWLLHLGIPEQAMCVLKLQVPGHVLINLSTADMITSLGFQLHGDAMLF